MNIQREILAGEVIEYAMASEENLRIAAEIYNNFPKLQVTVIKTLLSAFETSLVKNFAVEWFNDWLLEPLGHQKSFGCRHEDWPQGIYIGFGGEENANNIFYGVVVMDPDAYNTTTLLTNELPKTCLGHGKSDGKWPWFQYVDKKYRNWSAPNTLPNLLCDANGQHPLISHFEQEAVRIANAIDEVLKIYSR